MQKVIERHVTADPDLEEKLAMSKEGLKTKPLRTIRCPSCGFYLLDVVGHDHCYVRIKCRKCKFNEVIDTALFRTFRYLHRRKSFDNQANKRGKKCAFATAYSRKRKR